MLRRAAIRRTCEGACNVVCRRAQYSWFVSFALECVLESRVRPVFTLLTSLCLKFLCFMQVVRQARALQRQFATELGAAGRLLQSGPLPGACYRAGRLLPGACWSRALQLSRRAWALPGACERAARLLPGACWSRALQRCNRAGRCQALATEPGACCRALAGAVRCSDAAGRGRCRALARGPRAPATEPTQGGVSPERLNGMQQNGERMELHQKVQGTRRLANRGSPAHSASERGGLPKNEARPACAVAPCCARSRVCFVACSVRRRPQFVAQAFVLI